MSNNPIIGLNITGTIVPCTENDTYATHDSKYGKGGWREVETLAERDAIPADRRRLGMVVFVKETQTNYQLLRTSSNLGWSELKSGASEEEMQEIKNQVDGILAALPSKASVDYVEQVKAELEEEIKHSGGGTVTKDDLDKLEAKIDTKLDKKADQYDFDKLEEKVELIKADLVNYMTEEQVDEKIQQLNLDQYVTEHELQDALIALNLQDYVKTETLNRVIGAFEEKVDAVKEIADRNSGAIQAISDVMHDVSAELTEVKVQVTDAVSRVQEAETKVEENITKVEEAVEKVDEKTGEIEEIETELTETKTEVTNIQTQVNTVENIVIALNVPLAIYDLQVAGHYLSGQATEVIVTWIANKNPEKVELDGAEIEVEGNSYTFITSTPNHTIKFIVGEEVIEKPFVISFSKAVYFGVTTDEVPTIESFSNELPMAEYMEKPTRKFDCSEGKYIIFGFPVDADILFKINGLVYSDMLSNNVTLETGENYILYRTNEILTGSQVLVEVV